MFKQVNIFFKSLTLIFCMGVLGWLAGCKQTTEETIMPIRPVKTLLVDSRELAAVRQFPGKIEASRRADLAFRVSGSLAQLTVREGDEVRKGQIVARLNQDAFQLDVDKAQAQVKRTKSYFDRAKQMLAENFISQVAYDDYQANYETALADFNQAKLNLAYTTLKAPFSGTIAERKFENFQEIQAKETVMTLIDLSVLEVQVNVPESIVARLSNVRNRPEIIPVYATFNAFPENRFPLTFKEAANRADDDTQTFRAAFTMKRPDFIEVLPGMTVNVLADLSVAFGNPTVVYVPIQAIRGSNQGEATVFVVNEQTMTVKARRVELGQMSGDQVAVLSGLNSGERVVVAGVSYLSDGMKVTLLAD